MSKAATIKRRTRQRNSGGVYPEPMSVALTLLTALHRLRSQNKSASSHTIDAYDRQLFYFLYLWLTSDIEDCRTIEDIPTIVCLSGSQPCQHYALRSVRTNNISWVEYSLEHDTHNGMMLLWHPLPNGLNAYFTHALTQSREHWEMSAQEKCDFIAFLTTKWRSPSPLKGRYRLRRDVFFRYFKTMANLDSELSTLSKRTLLGENKLHHHSASAYQHQDTDQLRYEIFQAQTRYLDRLRQVITTPELEPMLNVPLPISKNQRSLLQKSEPLPEYLSNSGRIPQLHFDYTKAARNYIKTPSLAIGSKRMLDISEVRCFFSHLHQQGRELTLPQFTFNTLRDVINFRANELALLLIALTGVRPTHAITIGQSYCFNNQYAIVRDKGRWRSITLPSHLQQAILQFERLKAQLSQIFPATMNTNLLWFEVNEHGKPVPLTPKKLRHFMYRHWSQCNQNTTPVPYQLRHMFAQHARMANNPVLSTQDVDRLMGHTSFGEHLGSDMQFPASQKKLIQHLDGIANHLQLPPIIEAQ